MYHSINLHHMLPLIFHCSFKHSFSVCIAITYVHVPTSRQEYIYVHAYVPTYKHTYTYIHTNILTHEKQGHRRVPSGGRGAALNLWLLPTRCSPSIVISSVHLPSLSIVTPAPWGIGLMIVCRIVACDRMGDMQRSMKKIGRA